MKHLVSILCLISLCAGIFKSASAEYPDRPIKLVVGYAAGGPADASARHLASLVGKALGQTVVVDNRPGAGGSIAAAAVATAPSDGYTLLYASSDLVLYSALTGRVSFDPVRDFIAVTGISKRPLVLIVQPSLGVKSFQEFVALAKSKPEAINYESSGIGSIEHLAAEVFQKIAGIKLIHVPYKGSAPAISDMLAGHIQMGFEVPLSVLGHIRAGKLQPLAVTSTQRLASLPNIPTVYELGMPGLDTHAPWAGIFVPVGTPRDRVARLNKEFVLARQANETLNSATFAESTSIAGPSETFAEFVRNEAVKWKALIKEFSIKLE